MHADLRTQFWIADDTYYESYIDFDDLVWVTQFWNNSEMLSRREWQFRNSQFDWSARHADEEKEVDETVIDLWSDVDILDTSDNPSDNVREYVISVNSTYSITDYVQVRDPWTFHQQLKF